MKFVIEHLSKSFEKKEVLRDIDFTFDEGKIYGLLGRNGAGKTTLFNCLNRDLKADSGNFYIEDENGVRREVSAEDIGYVLSTPTVPEFLTGREFLKFFMDINEKSIKNPKSIDEYFDYMSIEPEDRDKLLKDYSHGMKNKMQMLINIIAQPNILLLDEPLGALDLRLRKDMQNELKNIQQRMGITFIYVTHDQEEALTMSDKIVVMNAGEIQQIGTPTEIYRTPVNEFVAKFIGETNIIDGVMLEDDLVMFEDKKYACRARGYNKNEKVDVVIRPEHLDIVPRAEGMLKGTVKSQLFKGMHYETVVETRVGTSITVKMQVSQDRPVYNEEKGEKISANAFLLDVEDVEELDDAKVVALASAEAWDVETEEPISIKNVEYDIKPETGNYTVTFATANDTSITVKVLVVAQNRVESKVYQEEIYAMNFFKKVEDIQESIALDTDLETWASASAWSLEDGEQVEITDVKYDFDPETITPGVYDVTFSTEGYEYKVSTTHAFEEGEQVGLVFRPEDIHVMKKEGQW